MNPSYARIHLPLENAIQQFSLWFNWPLPEERILVDSTKAIKLACDSEGQWHGPAVFVHHKNDWTVFEDLTGFLGSRSPQDWSKFAGPHDFVFAGYNDSIQYAELIAISGGEIVQDFFIDVSEPLLSRNKGSGLVDTDSWIDIAAFVDEDDLAYSDTGLLWQPSQGDL
jgi:hypothetical protein